MAEDRRITRTKRRLKQALLELIDEVGYESITIEQLTDRADVARSTFYSHYSDKVELLFAGFDRWLLSFCELAEPHPGSPLHFHFSLPLLRHAASQKGFFEKTIVRGPSHRVRRRLKEILATVTERELVVSGRAQQGEVTAGARGRAVAGAFLGLVEWWLDEGSQLTPEEVDRVFQQTVAQRSVSE